MAQGDISILKKRLNSESQSGDTLFKTRVSAAGQDATIAAMNLEPGDVLTEDTDYEIVESSIRYDRQADMRYAQVSAMKEVVVATGSPWSELLMSRRVITTMPTMRWQITFTGAITAARPKLGQTYRDVTGVSEKLLQAGMLEEPRIANVFDVKRATRNKAHITVVFEGLWMVNL